jgi:hypothetical protein
MFLDSVPDGFFKYDDAELTIVDDIVHIKCKFTFKGTKVFTRAHDAPMAGTEMCTEEENVGIQEISVTGSLTLSLNRFNKINKLYFIYKF